MEQNKETRIYRAAVYVRLSREDGDKEESDSIVNQKDLINSYLSGRQDITACMECVDDGYSGADFERPGVKRMMKGIEEGKIDCVIVKDDCVIIELNAESPIKCGFCAFSSIF